MKFRPERILAMTGIALAAYLAARASEAPSGHDETAPGTKDARAALRAFYTAPPVIPHEVTTRNNRECLHCHSDVRTLGPRTTVETPHANFFNCQQCHVGVQTLNRELELAELETSWKGLEEPRKGTRAHADAPPTVPHRLFMREHCTSCHGELHANADMRGPHGQRSSCLQCHALDFDADFHAR
jgi:hypothetical protein